MELGIKPPIHYSFETYMNNNDNRVVPEAPLLNKNPDPIKITGEKLLCESSDVAERLLHESPHLSDIQPSLNKNPDLAAGQLLHESPDPAEPLLHKPLDLSDIQASLNKKQKIMDQTGLSDHLLKCKEFVDLVERDPLNRDLRVKFAMWEESQGDLDRARFVWKDTMRRPYFKRDHSLWEEYANFEMRNKFLDKARCVWGQAVISLPRVEQLWCKYALMEETIGQLKKVRRVFEKWMRLEPDVGAWCAYINFEVRHKEIERARRIFERFVKCHPKASVWICYAGFEMMNGDTGRARTCYERAVDSLVDKANEEAEVLYTAFAGFEEGNKEIERARAVYEFAIKHIPEQRAKDLYRRFLTFEKQHGSKESTEDVIVVRKRLEYEMEVGENPLNYDSWYNYIILEESFGNKERIREVYKRAVANVPPANEKRFWQRYIYLWISYALFEEMEEQDVSRTWLVYDLCLKSIPHEKFSFSRVWVLAAAFEIRRLNLTGARRILETAILMAPRDKVFRTYIELELRLGNIKRCRTVYEKYLEWAPGRSYAWIQYAEMERLLGETERARAIFELAAAQSAALDMPNSLWKAYIYFQMAYGGFGRAKNLCQSPADSKKKVEKRRREEETDEYPDYIHLS